MSYNITIIHNNGTQSIYRRVPDWTKDHNSLEITLARNRVDVTRFVVIPMCNVIKYTIEASR